MSKDLTIRPTAGTARYYLFNGAVGRNQQADNEPAAPYSIRQTDALPDMNIGLNINGVMAWDFGRYFLRVVYWPAAITEGKLDTYVVALLKKTAEQRIDFFPFTEPAELEITPAGRLSNVLPDVGEIKAAQEAAGFNPDRFAKAPATPHKRVYDLCKSSHEHGQSAPIVELNGGEYDREAFRKLVEPVEAELMLLNGVLAVRVVREQIEITYRAGLDIELLDGFVGMVVQRFKSRTEDDMSVFHSLKKGAPIKLFLNPRQACVC